MGEGDRPPEMGQRGSALMLLPAGVLVVIMLGSIAVDFAVVFLAERELVSAAAAAANDAATVGIDVEHFRQTGEVRLDPVLARRAAEAAISRRASAFELRAIEVVVDGGLAVEVRLAAEVDYVFAAAVPGVARHAVVDAAARAEPRVR